MKRFPFWRLLPVVFLAVFYWLAFDTWFYQDDFGWLNLNRDIHGWQDLPGVLFAPKAGHGIMRPLSVTGFFVFFQALFGLNPLPFHIAVFATQAAALLLLGDIVQRLTGSRAAAFWAQILWAANTALAVVMCWISIYNQALCGFFLLLAFWCLLRYLETADRRWWLAQWAAFLAGFGALETNVVYPLIAAVYTRVAAPKQFRRTLPLFAASAAYMALHFAVAPAPAGGVYALHPDASMAATLWTYWKMALGPERLAAVVPVAPWLAAAATAVLTCAAALAALRVRAAWFGLAWFVVALAPFLPLRDHVMDYYAAVPAAGLGILGGAAFAGSRRAKIAASVCAAIYLGFSLPASWAVMRWHHARSQRVETLVLGVKEVHAARPDATILLTGVDTDLFLAGMVDLPFRLLDIPRVYLAPGAGGAIASEMARWFTLPDALAARELESGRGVVYDASGSVLRNVTRRYRETMPLDAAAAPRFVNIADPLFAACLGPGWGEAASGYRGFRGEASLRIGPPRAPGEKLRLGVFSPGMPDLRVLAGGTELRPERISREGGRFDYVFEAPAGLRGGQEIEIRLRSAAGAVFGFADVR